MLQWIKLTTDLWLKPETLAIKRLAKVRSVDEVIGKLARFWTYAETYSVAGHISGMTPADLDELVGKRGFAAAMIAVGWLRADDHGLTVPDYERYMGAGGRTSAWEAAKADRENQKKRRNADRAKRLRDRNKSDQGGDGAPHRAPLVRARGAHGEAHACAPCAPKTKDSRGEILDFRSAQELYSSYQTEPADAEQEDPGPAKPDRPTPPPADPSREIPPAQLSAAYEAEKRSYESEVVRPPSWEEFAGAWVAAGLTNGETPVRSNLRVGQLQQRATDPEWLAGWRAAIDRLGRSEWARRGGISVAGFLGRREVVQNALEGVYDRDFAREAARARYDRPEYTPPVYD